ncbi:hypothetical protein B0F90DRAFT_1771166 [Multifurca ochricompacta]|uniref:Uncharacterized protein n=1 Tax=Multifurca ochricompacta TaxID=376703 RepID=A0AAD4QFN1_9AGAM|nr:hypothetical protein B0F90DRAFT_1771166 [Multifurca ochricompacta]
MAVPFTILMRNTGPAAHADGIGLHMCARGGDVSYLHRRPGWICFSISRSTCCMFGER